MKRGKNRALKVIAIYTALISILTIYLSIKSPPRLYKITKIAAEISAELSFFGGDIKQINLNKDSIINVDKSKTDSIDKDLSSEKENGIPIISVSNGSLWSIDMAPEEIESPADKDDDSELKSIEDMLEALPYPDNIETKSGIIKEVSYNKAKGSQYISLEKSGLVRNVTSVSNDILISESKKLPEFNIKLNSEPQVLIMHTHTTESYEPYERAFYDSSFNSRTTDVKMNVVAVGDAIAKELEDAGIGVIHDTTLFDYPSYNGSYERSAKTVKKILKENPSIKVVLDVHRDAIQSDSVRNAPIAEIDGKKAAQIMIISGCDDGTMNMPNYLQNFRLSSLLQQEMESKYPGLTRPVLFDYRKYNQDLTTGSILLEMGSHGNSIDQAIYSGKLLGKSLAESLKKLT